MRITNKTATLSFFAAICFFAAFFIHKETIYLIFGCVWIAIAIEEYLRMKRNDK